jgi:hypothetical protein
MKKKVFFALTLFALVAAVFAQSAFGGLQPPRSLSARTVTNTQAAVRWDATPGGGQ